MYPEGDRMFTDRSEAGQVLGERVAAYLRELGIHDRPLVLGLPRGGLPVAEEVAQAVDGDLDLHVSRKIGFPGHPEFGIGAVAEHGPPFFSREVLRRAGLTEQDLAGEVERQRAEVRRRLERYRGDRPPPVATDRVVVVVDDGLATGVTAHAALASLRRQRPRHLMYAAPVCARDAADSLAEADSVVCVHTADDFGAVGAWYWDFTQTTDEDVVDILNRAWAGGRAG
jgi:predicted phosphoribosyltransferase